MNFEYDASGSLIFVGLATYSKTNAPTPTALRVTYYSLEILYQENPVSFSHSPVGSIRFSGVAEVDLGEHHLASGRLRISGIASAIVAFTPQSGGANGTLFLSGTASPQGALSFTPAGRLIFSGQSQPTSGMSHESAGRLVFSGLAPHNIQAQSGSSGALTLTGSATVVRNFYDHVMQGGFALSGILTVSEPYFFPVVATGKLLLLGDINSLYEHFYEANGLLRFSGVSSGIFAQKGTAEKEFTWRVRQGAEITKEFTWATGPRPLSVFRVVGKCKPPRVPPLAPFDCPTHISFTVNIVARNLSEVCRKLKEREFRFPILRIEKFSNPLSTNDLTSDINPRNNVLEDVTPGFTLLECVDLLVDYNATADMAMSSVAIIVSAPMAVAKS